MDLCTSVYFNGIAIPYVLLNTYIFSSFVNICLITTKV